MARKQEHCCDCILTQNRCSSEICPCYSSGRICDEHCESVKYRLDCLNQAICKCNCESGQNATSEAGHSSTASAASANANATSGKKPCCAKPEKCECLRLRESCNRLCACHQICKNKDVRKPQKAAKPKQGCNCSKSKRQCLKKDCPCRTVFDFCGPNCKCGAECTNSNSKFHVPKHIQQCFLEHKLEQSGLVVSLIGDEYLYRTDFFHDSKSEPHVEEQLIASMYELISKYHVDLYEIVIFVSKSPCFHQDCDPKCEIIDDCKSNKACSKLLTLLLSKVRKELGKVDVKMTVKFLFPHLHRGDLYTKQGLLCMLQNGIVVEPLLMKDWSQIMDWTPVNERKGEYLKVWNDHGLDKAVAQSQAFVNECRRAMGLGMKFWVAEIHEIVKNTILNYTDIRGKLQDLNDGLKQLDLTATPSKIRSTPSKRRSFLDILELRGATSSRSAKRLRRPLRRDTYNLLALRRVACFCCGGVEFCARCGCFCCRCSSCSGSYESGAREAYCETTTTASTIDATEPASDQYRSISRFALDRIHVREPKSARDGSNPSLTEDTHAQAMVASFCGRSFDSSETNEIAERIRRATYNINIEIESLMEFLNQKGN